MNGPRTEAQPPSPADDERDRSHFTVTDRAAAELRRLLQRPALRRAAVRIEALPGAAPSSYELGLDDVPRADDVVVELAGVRFRLDPASADSLRDVTLDYVDTLHGSGFTFAPTTVRGGGEIG